MCLWLLNPFLEQHNLEQHNLLLQMHARTDLYKLAYVGIQILRSIFRLWSLYTNQNHVIGWWFCRWWCHHFFSLNECLKSLVDTALNQSLLTGIFIRFYQSFLFSNSQFACSLDLSLNLSLIFYRAISLYNCTVLLFVCGLISLSIRSLSMHRFIGKKTGYNHSLPFFL